MEQTVSPLLERYLDRLFDRLSGTGAAGRRILTETEAHLTERVDDLIAQGLAPDAAAQAAISQFGAPEAVANAMVTKQDPGRLVFRQVIASVWVFAATILITAGVSGALCWLIGCMLGPAIMAPEGAAMIQSAQVCADLMAAHPLAHDCMDAIMQHNFDGMVFSSLAAGLAGCALLALYFAAAADARAARYTTLPPKNYMFVAGVTAFGFSSAVWIMDGFDDYARSVSWDWMHDFARGGAALLTAIFFIVAAYRHMRGTGEARTFFRAG